MLNRPAGAEGRRFPGVLFLHGFPGGEKNVDIQRRLQGLGVASYSLHFSGAWGSEGYYSFGDLIPQARAALAVLARQDFVDRNRLGVFGFSMGGWAAVNLAAYARNLKAAAAVAPVGGLEMINPDTPEHIAVLSRPLRVRSQKFLYRDLVSTLEAYDPARSAVRLKRPLLLVHGDCDEVVPIEVSRRIFQAALGPKKFVVAGGCRHDFLDRREWLSRLISDLLAKHLR
jgi:dipeptidyl aminopeptidase/acylaminoacyl peptidase